MLIIKQYKNLFVTSKALAHFIFRNRKESSVLELDIYFILIHYFSSYRHKSSENHGTVGFSDRIDR